MQLQNGFHNGLNESATSASSRILLFMILMLCGSFPASDPISVYAKMGSMRIKKFEDYAHIMLTYEDGKSAFIETNWLTPYKTRTLTVTGSEAIMRLDYITQDLWIEQQTQTVQPRYPFQEPLKAELQHFVDCIVEKKKPIVTGEDGVRALTVATAAIESSAKNKAIRIKKIKKFILD